MRANWFLASSCFVFAMFFLVARSPGQQASPAAGPDAPFVFDPAATQIYVSDFELDAQDYQADEGSRRGQRSGALNGPRHKEQDPAANARKMVDLLANELVGDLKKAGYKAQRLPTGAERPNEGVWVRGVFAEMDEGNRLRRAVVGFGSGEASMQLYVTMSSLARPEQALYTMNEGKSSGKGPGAVISLNPYVAAAKFVMQKNAPEKTIKKTADDISKEIIGHLKEHQSKAGSATH